MIQSLSARPPRRAMPPRRIRGGAPAECRPQDASNASQASACRIPRSALPQSAIRSGNGQVLVKFRPRRHALRSALRALRTDPLNHENPVFMALRCTRMHSNALQCTRRVAFPLKACSVTTESAAAVASPAGAGRPPPNWAHLGCPGARPLRRGGMSRLSRLGNFGGFSSGHPWEGSGRVDANRG